MKIKYRHILLSAVIGLTALILGLGQTGRSAARQRRQPRPTAKEAAFEASQTAKLLGVPLQNFPAPQGLAGFDELPANAATFKFTLTPRPVTGSTPRFYFETRSIVSAQAPDGTIYEAYCGYDDPAEIVPGHGYVSNFENRRQYYDDHFGYGYMPQDVYIGKLEAGRIKPALFFRDVGSHTTAPHALAIDSEGMVHLAVADVNISQDNRLDFYYVIGDPKTGKWKSAWLIDRRGFTSSSQPASAAWSDKVHVTWEWSDMTFHKSDPRMGLFHVEWSPKGFGPKTRVFAKPVDEHDDAVDPQTGTLVIVLAKYGGGVYLLSRSAAGKWTRPSLVRTQVLGPS